MKWPSVSFRSLRKSPPPARHPSGKRGHPAARGYSMGETKKSRNRARWLEQNNNLARKFLIMVKTNVVGAKGIRLQSLAANVKGATLEPSPLDRQLIESAHATFSKARNFSLCGQINRRTFAQIGIQRVIVDGECIVHKVPGAENPFRFANQLIDAELLDHELNRQAGTSRNEIRMGVEIDAVGRPVAYYFLKAAPLTWGGAVSFGQNHKRVPAQEIEHIFFRDRPGQTRGVTHLMATGERAKMLDAIERAVAIGYRVAASKMGIVTRNENYEPVLDSKTGMVQEDFSDVPENVEAGEIWELPEGLDFETFDPGYPGANYAEYTKSITRSMAAGLGVSYPEFGNDFEGVSYSAGQIGVHSDIAFWSDLQQFWIDAFEEPNFLDWLPMAITSGAVHLPMSKLAKFERVKFQPPRRKHIDPLKTHKAQSIALGDMTRDPFEIAAENGCDFEDVVEGFARAKALLESAGLPMPQSWGAVVEVSEGELAQE